MSDANQNLKERVRAFWQAQSLRVKFADAEPGTRRFLETRRSHRYKKEWAIPIGGRFCRRARFENFGDRLWP